MPGTPKKSAHSKRMLISGPSKLQGLIGVPVLMRPDMPMTDSLLLISVFHLRTRSISCTPVINSFRIIQRSERCPIFGREAKKIGLRRFLFRFCLLDSPVFRAPQASARWIIVVLLFQLFIEMKKLISTNGSSPND